MSFLELVAAAFLVASFLVLIWVGHSQLGQRAMGLSIGLSLTAAILATVILALLSYFVHLSTFGLLLRREYLGLNDPVFGGFGGKLTLPAAAALLISVAATAASLIFGACLLSLLFDRGINQDHARRAAFFHALCLLLALLPLMLDAFLWGYRFYADISERGWGAAGIIAAGMGLLYFCALLVLGVWLHYLFRVFRAIAIVGGSHHTETVQPLSSTQQFQPPQVFTPQQQFQAPPVEHAPQSQAQSSNFLNNFEDAYTDNDGNGRNFAPLTRQRRDRQ